MSWGCRSGRREEVAPGKRKGTNEGLRQTGYARFIAEDGLGLAGKSQSQALLFGFLVTFQTTMAARRMTAVAGTLQERTGWEERQVI